MATARENLHGFRGMKTTDVSVVRDAAAFCVSAEMATVVNSASLVAVKLRGIAIVRLRAEIMRQVNVASWHSHCLTPGVETKEAV